MDSQGAQRPGLTKKSHFVISTKRSEWRNLFPIPLRFYLPKSPIPPRFKKIA